MELKRIFPKPEELPEQFRTLLTRGAVYDSSCSQAARLYYFPEPGLFLKAAPKGSLQQQALMTDFFAGLGLTKPVLDYVSLEKDYLLTQQVPGKDCIEAEYLRDPKRLSQTFGELLRQLHEMPTAGCPIPNRTEQYLHTAREHYRLGQYDRSHFPDSFGYQSPEEAFRVVSTQGKYLQQDVLLHGDYCLPNVILDNWQFSGFVDVDSGGVGDRHIDLFWGIWSLNFNLKTQAYRDRFLDAYGRDRVNQEVFPVIAAAEVFG